MSRFIFSLCLLLVARVMWVPVTSAQTATGEISGQIRDASDAVVGLANITVVSLETGAERAVQSNAEGHYVVPLLRPGTYRVTVAKPGFQLATVSNIKLDVNQSLIEDIALDVSGVVQRTEVRASAELLQQSGAQLGPLI